MLGRLVEPVELAEENRAAFLEILIKKAKKLIVIAELMNCPEIIQQMFKLGIINEKNQKGIRKILANSSVPEIAQLAKAELECEIINITE